VPISSWRPLPPACRQGVVLPLERAIRRHASAARCARGGHAGIDAGLAGDLEQRPGEPLHQPTVSRCAAGGRCAD
jgi:hypothetical protein